MSEMVRFLEILLYTGALFGVIEMCSWFIDTEEITENEVDQDV